MFRLITLGGLDLTAPGGHRVQSVLQQPKRAAILVYLAIEGRGRSVQRDGLLAAIWPDCDEATARSRLKQAVHFLRCSLGEGVIPCDRSGRFHVDPAMLSTDVADFLDAVEAGRWNHALSLHQGELLPHFHLDDCHEFDCWLDGQRRRVRAAASDAARGVARDAAEAGDLPSARRAVERVLEMGADPGCVREALEVLARAGDPTGVSDAFATYEQRLAAELGMGPPGALRSRVAELIEQASTCRPGENAMPRGTGHGSAPVAAVPEGDHDPSDRVPSAPASPHMPDDGPVTLLMRPFEACDDALAVTQARLLSSMLRHRLARERRHVIHDAELALAGSAAASTLLVMNGLVRRVGEEILAELVLTRAEDAGVLWTSSLSWAAESTSLDDVVPDLAMDVASAMDLAAW